MTKKRRAQDSIDKMEQNSEQENGRETDNDDGNKYVRRFISMDEGWDGIIKPKAIDRLQAMLDEGLKAGQTKIFGPREYIQIYTTCFDMCTQEGDFASELYARHGTTIRDYLQKTVLVALQKHQSSSTTTTCSPTLFLQQVSDRWTNHCIMIKWLVKFFSYLERSHIPQFNLPTLGQVAIQAFEEEIYQPLLKEKATEAILELIAQERQGHLIENKTLVKRTVTLYEAMGNGVVDVGLSTLRYYHADLELPVLHATRDYYHQKRRQYMLDLSTPAYLIKVEEALMQEKVRVTEYLNASASEASLLAVVEQELLVPVQNVLLENPASGCRALLQNEKSTDLQRMFRLFSRLEKTTYGDHLSSTSPPVLVAAAAVPAAEAAPEVVVADGDEATTLPVVVVPPPPPTAAVSTAPTKAYGLKPIAAIVEEFILDCGNDIIGGRKARYLSRTSQHNNGNTNHNAKEKNKLEDSKFIKALIELHEKQLAIVERDFYGHAFFQRALKNAFDKIINTQVGGGDNDGGDGEGQAVQIPTNAELLSTICDGILRGKLSDQQLEEELECVVRIFCYLQDKDLFAEVYSNQLARRLLDSRSTSTSRDAEKCMIAKLKVQVGAQFTSKMEGMLADVCLGQEQKQDFEQYVRKQQQSLSTALSVDLSVQVLNRGNWPFYKELSVVTLPSSLSSCMQVYQHWHEQKHAKRKLMLVLTQGSALVRATFPNKKTYDLQVSTLQAIILDALSGGIMRSFEEMARTLNLEVSILKPMLHSLSCGKYKVIRKSPGSNKILTTDTFIANEKFSCNARKFRIPAPSLESLLNLKKVHADRSIVIDARIVRIMKARKTLPHQQLLSEVLSQLSLFKPNPRQVKKRIETLIEREYLERSSENSSVYNYLA